MEKLNSKVIIKEKIKSVFSIILNSPKNGNALSQSLIKELNLAFDNLSKNSKCRIIIIESNSKIFCAGADLKELKKMQKNSYEENLEDSKNLMTLFNKILSIEKLVIAKVDGASIAGGCGLATACDIVFGTEKAKFGYTEVNIGFVPAIVSTFLPKRVNGFLSKKILLTGEILNSEKALNINLIDFYVKSSDLDKKVDEFVQNFLNKSSPQSVSEIKKMLYNFFQIEKKLNLACEINAKARNGTDCIKGVNRFLNKEKNNWN